MIRKLLLAALAVATFGRAQPPPLSFEVASIRVAAQKPPRSPMPAAGEITGGPGTADPARLTYTWVLARRLLMEAFGLPLDQISGSDWVMGQDARFDIVANVPAGATKAESQEMLLNLLKDRFHLTYHREKKDFPLYTLVLAKGGPKLKDAAPADGPLAELPQVGTPARAAPTDADGFPQLPFGRPGMQGRGGGGGMRLTFRMSTMQMLLQSVEFSLGPSRSEDKTGLTGKYDFNLMYSEAGLPGPGGRAPRGAPDDSDAGPDLFTALEKQLGLRLEKSKTQLDVVIVDHMDKEPTEN